jgi:hypothetical protein
LQAPVIPSLLAFHRGKAIRRDDETGWFWMQTRRGDWVSAGWKTLDECFRWIRKNRSALR